MKEIQITVNVWYKDTKWGDTIYFACDKHNWQRTCALTTTAETFPWWRGQTTIHVDDPTKSTAIEYKLFVWRDDSYPIWETFTGNRKYSACSSETSVGLTLKFGALSWMCNLCSTAIYDEIPVICPRQQHPMHAECFELYLSDELEHKRTTVKCMKCVDNLPEAAWKGVVNERIYKRYKRVVAENNGATVLRCPMSDCDFELICNEDGGTSDIIPDSINCGKCGSNWCTNCDRLVQDECKVCVNGLKTIADQVFDALEEVAGVKCPTCQQRGQKLPCECTHITCDCGTVYCYCCGMSGADVDTSDVYASSDIDRLYGHNDDYLTNDQRCPMWLVNFGDLIQDWPDDVDHAQKKFHKMKASKKLNEVKTKLQSWEWDSLMDLDENIKNTVEKFLNKIYTPC